MSKSLDSARTKLEQLVDSIKGIGRDAQFYWGRVVFMGALAYIMSAVTAARAADAELDWAEEADARADRLFGALAWLVDAVNIRQDQFMEQVQSAMSFARQILGNPEYNRDRAEDEAQDELEAEMPKEIAEAADAVEQRLDKQISEAQLAMLDAMEKDLIARFDNIERFATAELGTIEQVAAITRWMNHVSSNAKVGYLEQAWASAVAFARRAPRLSTRRGDRLAAVKLWESANKQYAELFDEVDELMEQRADEITEREMY